MRPSGRLNHHIALLAQISVIDFLVVEGVFFRVNTPCRMASAPFGIHVIATHWVVLRFRFFIAFFPRLIAIV